MNTVTQKSQRWPWVGGSLLMALLVAVMALAAVAHVSAQSSLITGTVTDPGGGLPPAGTLVHLVSPSGDDYGKAAVDAVTGAFSLGPVSRGNYLLQARAPAGSNYTPSLPYSLIMTGESVDVGALALTDPSITGAVYQPDGVTPATAVVRVFKAGYQIQSMTTISGAIQLGGLLSGTYTILADPATDDPFWLSPRQPLTVTDGVTQTLDLTLQPANVAGVVTDPNGAPMAGATVHVIGAVNHQYRRDVTGGTGYFAIGDLPDDTYLLRAEPPWNAFGLIASPIVTFTVPPDFTDLGTIALRNAPKIVDGLVETNTGVPVEDALVVANRLDYPGRQETLTANDGAYSLKLSGGLWSLSVAPTDTSNPSDWVYANPPLLVHFDKDLQPESKTVNFEVTTADSTVTGIVEMPDGSTPTFTVTVGLRTNEGIGRSTLIDPADGSFTLEVPNGNYVLHIRPDDPGYAGPPPQEIYAPISDTLDLGTLTLLERDATISGAVMDGAGNGVEGVEVIGWTRDHLGAQTVTNPDGTYALAVTAGDWSVKPVVPPDMPYIFAGLPLSATVASQQNVTGMDFVLTDANNVVVGQLVDENGDPVHEQGWAAAGDENGPVNGAPIEGGNFTIYLPDGSYNVSVHLSPGSDWLAGNAQPVTVAGGETVSLTVPLLPQDANIVGSLWDPRQEIVPTGVEGYVMAGNPFAWVGDDIEPANGTFKLGVSAGLWRLGYVVAPESGYVAINHHKIIPLESGQTIGTALPVVYRDSVIEGVVLKPDGSPFPGAVVAADGLGDRLDEVTLRTYADENGEFSLEVPWGFFRLRAAHERPENWLNPVLKSVIVPPDSAITGIVLQFRESDVTLSGVTSIEGNPGVDGRVHIWAYTEDGAATKTTAMLGETYTLNLLSNLRWHIGAVLETSSSYYVVRTAVSMGASNETLDLVLAGPYPKPGPVVITFDAAESQHVELADGTKIYIPAGAMPVSGEVTLHITPIATFPNQNHARLYKYGYAFVATDETGAPITQSFNQNVTIRFQYEDEELYNLGLSEAHLKPAYYSTTTQSWTFPESYVVDSDSNEVTMQIDHFTDFSLLSSASYQVFLPMIVR